MLVYKHTVHNTCVWTAYEIGWQRMVMCKLNFYLRVGYDLDNIVQSLMAMQVLSREERNDIEKPYLDIHRK